MTNTSTLSKNTIYLNTTKENYLAWRRDICATLSNHNDKLLTIVTDKTLSKTIEVKLKTQYKSLGDEFTEGVKEDYITEYNTTAYHIILPTIGDTTVKKTIEREYGADADAHGILNHIDDIWSTASGDVESRLIAKNTARTELIAEGPKSGTLAHMADFVETLLDLNEETAGTDFEWNDTITTTHVLDALYKFKPSFVDGFKGVHSAKKEWRKDFGKVWTKLKNSLENMDATADTAANLGRTDVLTTTNADPRDAVINQLTAQVQALTTMVEKMSGTTVTTALRTGGNPQNPLCIKCNTHHKPNPDHGCLGEAYATGKITEAQGLKAFSWARNPAAVLEAAKKAYLKTQGKSDDAVPSKPEKSIHLVTSANPVPWTGDGLTSVNVIKAGTETDCKHVLKFDTQAEHTILTDSALFPDGVDTTNVLEISTITPGPRPRTSGCGTAVVTTADGRTINI